MKSKMAMNPTDSATLASDASVSAAVAKFSGDLFQGAVSIRNASDPEFPSKYFIVSVVARGETDDLVELNDRWHREICTVAGEAASHYRLSLDVQ